MRGTARLLCVVACLAALAGCGVARAAVPIINPIDPNAMEPCNQAPLAFTGTTTLAALGLHQFAGGAEVARPGQIWITADAIVPADWRAGPPGAPPPEPARFACVEWDDGSGMAGSLDPAWQLPSGLASSSSEGESPLPMVGVLGLVLACVVISMLAFRRA